MPASIVIYLTPAERQSYIFLTKDDSGKSGSLIQGDVWWFNDSLKRIRPP
jgi:hypothetical protein